MDGRTAPPSAVENSRSCPVTRCCSSPAPALASTRWRCGPAARTGPSGSARTSARTGDPVGNALNESLIQELMRSTTILPTDLELLDDVDGLDADGTDG